VILDALSHPLRAEILARLDERSLSPTELAAGLDVPLPVVAYHVRKLEDAGLVRLVERRRPRASRGGHPQSYYRAEPVTIPDDEWLSVPPLVRRALTAAALRELSLMLGLDPDAEPACLASAVRAGA
jgi:DNA-binding transcriptional ArsR family regulator